MSSTHGRREGSSASSDESSRERERVCVFDLRSGGKREIGGMGVWKSECFPKGGSEVEVEGQLTTGAGRWVDRSFVDGFVRIKNVSTVIESSEVETMAYGL